MVFFLSQITARGYKTHSRRTFAQILIVRRATFDLIPMRGREAERELSRGNLQSRGTWPTQGTSATNTVFDVPIDISRRRDRKAKQRRCCGPSNTLQSFELSDGA